MERPNAKGANNFVVGLFVFVALLVGAGFVVFMGGVTSIGGETRFKVFFNDVRGLNVGAPVFLQGIQVGRVANFEFPDETKQTALSEHGIVSVISIYSQFRDRVKVDSEAEITTMGVLGDKVVTLTPGSMGAETLDPSQFIKAIMPTDFTQYFAKGGNLVESLNEVAANLNLLLKDINQQRKVTDILKNLESVTSSLAVTTKNLADAKGSLGGMIQGGEKDDLAPILMSLRKMIDKINKGEGTLGALINDPTLHEDLKILLGGAKRSQSVRFLLRQAISASEESDSGKKK